MPFHLILILDIKSMDDLCTLCYFSHSLNHENIKHMVLPTGRTALVLLTLLLLTFPVELTLNALLELDEFGVAKTTQVHIIVINPNFGNVFLNISTPIKKAIKIIAC